VAEPFLSEIRLFSFNFAPKGWALCNGQILPINQNQALFSLLGTTYGGDGRVNFALPDLRERVAIGVSNAHTLGLRAGEQAHTLSQAEMPAHAHAARGTNAGATTANPSGALLAAANNLYRPAGQPLTTLHPQSVTSAGGSQPHTNMQPYLTISFCIALQGIFPSRN